MRQHRCLVLLALSLLAVLPACGPIPGPTPTPTPTPTPPPGQDLLLRREGDHFIDAAGKRFEVKLDARCCSTDTGEPDPNWSIGSKAAIDDAAAKGATVVTMRLGPFRIGSDWTWGHEIGGPYVEVGDPAVAGVVGGTRHGTNRFPWREKIKQLGLIHPENLPTRADLSQWNPRYFAYVNEIIAYAASKGLHVEIDVDDGWGIKHCKRKDIGDYHPWQKENNLQGQDLCDAAGTIEVQPGDPYDKWIRKVVAEFGHNSGVLWQIGNENNLIPHFSSAWELSHAAIIKDEELKRGYKAHPIGTQTENAGIIADSRIDFSEWHTQGEAISNPATCGGKPCGVNEYNPEPALEPVAVQNSYCTAKANGTWFGLWRHSMSRPSWDEAWRLVGLPCGPAACLPYPEDGRWNPVCKTRADIPGVAPLCSTLDLSDQKASVLATAETKAVADNPNLFSGSCLIDLNEANVIRGLNAIGAAARSAGECGGKKDDAVFLRRNDGTMDDEYWQEEHAIVYATGCFTQVSNAWKYIWRHPPSETQPPPTPACALTNAQIAEWRWDLKKEGGQLVDLTVYVCGPAARAELKQCGNSCCPLGDTEGNGACREKLLGDPIFETVGAVTIIPQGTAPIFTVKVNTGDGFLKARGSKGPNAFKKWHIFAAVPACEVGADGNCLWSTLP
jgi:hypothetical protein